jgi:hypothetical protein
MPYTTDVRSMMEQSVVVMLSSPSPAHARRSAQRAVADLAESLDPEAASTSSGSSSDSGPAEHFEVLMADALASFEGAQRLKGLADDHQLEALARLHATALAELDARHSQSWVDRTPLSAREAVVMEVAAATGLGHADLSLRLELAIGSPARTSFLREQVRTGESTLQRACELVRETRELTDELADQVARTALAPTRDGAGLPGQPAAATVPTPRSGVTAPGGSPSPTTPRRSWPPSSELTPRPAQPAPPATPARSTSCGPTSSPASPSTAGPRATLPLHAPRPLRPGEPSSSCRSRRPWDSTRRRVSCPVTASSVRPRPARSSPPRARCGRPCSRDVDTGRALTLSRTAYRPSREMVEHVRAVDGVCRGPGCTVAAHRCDLDHCVPWPTGPTAAYSLIASDRAHHRIRTAGWWAAERDDDARVTWRTAAGRTYVTQPADWLDGLRGGPSSAPPLGQPEKDGRGTDPPPF